MRKTKILPTVLFILVPATVLSTAPASHSEPATDECRSKPGAAGPPGSHWFYHINRADGRHCWYLSAEGEKLRLATPKSASRAAAPETTLLRENSDDAAASTPPAPMPAPHTTRLVPAQIAAAAPTAPPAPSATAPGNTTAPAAANTTASAAPPSAAAILVAPGMDFATRWQTLPKSPDPTAHDAAATNNNPSDRPVPADHAAGQDTTTALADAAPLPSADVSATDDSAAPPEPPRSSDASATSAGSVFLAGVLIAVSSLVFAGGVVRLANRPRRRRAMRWLKARRPVRAYFGKATPRGPVAAAPARAAVPSAMPTDPAADMKTSLQELMGDLRRAGASSPSLQSFVPSTYQRPKRSAAQKSAPANGAEAERTAAADARAEALRWEEELLRHFGGDVMVANNAG